MPSPMQIESMTIKNYRCLREIVLDNLTRMTIVVGANGSGKSSLFDVFAFLKDALSQNVATAVAQRGRYRELFSRGQAGPIEITVKFRERGGRLATYQLKINQDNGRVVVEHETLSYRKGQGGRWEWRFVDCRLGKGEVITNESEYGVSATKGSDQKKDKFELDDPSTLAIKSFGQRKEFPVVFDFRSLIDNWHISDLHIADARPSVEVGYAEHLSTRGDNVALVAQYLYENHPQQFSKVLQAMRQRVPGVSDVEAKPTEDGFTTVRRASDSELLQSLIHEGDRPGALWRQGVFDLPGLFWRQTEHEGTRPQ